MYDLLPCIPTPPTLPPAAAFAAQQASMFVANTGTALSTVKYLELTVSDCRDALVDRTNRTQTVTEMLLPLAAALTQLQKLSLSGQIGTEFLQHLGYSCPKLSRLAVVISNVSTHSLTKLGILLPGLTNLAIIASRRGTISGATMLTFAALFESATQQRASAAICTALKACSSLVSLNTGGVELSPKIWQELPPGLQNLVCPMPSAGLAKGQWQLHASLRKLVLPSTESKSLTITGLKTLLSACPNLEMLSLPKGSHIQASFSRASATRLQYLQQRLSLGLVLSSDVGSSLVCGSARPVSCQFALVFSSFKNASVDSDAASEHFEHPMSHFMTDVIAVPLDRITEVIFDNKNSRYTSFGLAHVPEVFPNLKVLTVRSVDFEPGDLPALLGCEQLQSLMLKAVGGFSGPELRLFCSKAKALKSVHTWECMGISLDEGLKFGERTGMKRSWAMVAVEPQAQSWPCICDIASGKLIAHSDDAYGPWD